MFSPPAMSVWICMGDEVYGFPDMEGRGFKLAIDRHGPEFDPDSGDRLARGLPDARAFLAERFPALAAAPTSLNGVISNLQTWLVGLLATVATLFLTIAGVRYLTAGGDPGQVERAKVALKSAAIGYALAALAPLIVSVLAGLFG